MGFHGDLMDFIWSYWILQDLMGSIGEFGDLMALNGDFVGFYQEQWWLNEV